MRKIILVGMFFILSFSGCDLIEYHPYDGRVRGETGINAKNITKIEKLCAGKDTIRFAMLGDTQRCYDETELFVKHINKRKDIDFIVHGGDLADFGLTREFEWMRDILSGLKAPYVALLGNHDCLANGEQVFSKIWGSPNFSFLAGNIKFICLNTNALEYDYSRPVPDFQFMEKELESKADRHEKTIFAMHVPPFDSQFNNNVAKVFQMYIKQFPNLQFCLNAHTHHYAANDLFNDGVIYYSPADISKRSYLIFTIKPGDNEYEYELVEF